MQLPSDLVGWGRSVNAAQFAEFWQRQGFRAINSGSCWWYSPYPFLYASLPFHRFVAPSCSELAHVFTRGLAALVRFPTVSGTRPNGGLFLCSDPGYDLHSLDQKGRNRVRRALKKCAVERIDLAVLANSAYSLVHDTILRQGRDPAVMTAKRWHRYCEAAGETPDTEAWAAFVDGRLASFLIAALVEDHFTFLYQCSATDTLQYAPNNILIFTVTRHGISRPGVASVCYGLQSIEQNLDLDHFKLTMGFKLRPAKLEVVLNPLVKLLIACGGRKGLAWMARSRHKSDFWRKAGTLLKTLDVNDRL